MKRIIFDCDLMKYPHTGLYRYCLNLGLNVQPLLKQDGSAKISFYVPPSASGSFGSSASQIIEKKSVWNIFRPFLRNCDIWHAPFQSGRIIPDKKKYPHIRILLTIHDLNSLHEGKSPEEQRGHLAHTQALINKSDAIVCVSEFTKQDVLQHCDIGTRPIYVVHNGANELPDPLLFATSYKPQRPFLFGIGYVNRKKNYDVLLSLLKDNEELELVVAGYQDEPDYVKGMWKKAEDLGIADRLKLPGPISEHEKAWYLKHCTAFVHPSLAEGFGFPVIEAMSAGRPVFISDKTALPEIGGDAAFYFSTFEPDHMQRVFAEGMQRFHTNGVSEKIKKRSEQFKWEKSAAGYMEVYKSLY